MSSRTPSYLVAGRKCSSTGSSLRASSNRPGDEAALDRRARRAPADPRLSRNVVPDDGGLSGWRSPDARRHLGRESVREPAPSRRRSSTLRRHPKTHAYVERILARPSFAPDRSRRKARSSNARRLPPNKERRRVRGQRARRLPESSSVSCCRSILRYRYRDPASARVRASMSPCSRRALPLLGKADFGVSALLQIFARDPGPDCRQIRLATACR